MSKIISFIGDILLKIIIISFTYGILNFNGYLTINLNSGYFLILITGLTILFLLDYCLSKNIFNHIKKYLFSLLNNIYNYILNIFKKDKKKTISEETIIYKVIKDKYFLFSLTGIGVLLISSFFLSAKILGIIGFGLELMVVVMSILGFNFVWNISKDTKERLIGIIISTPVLILPFIFAILILIDISFNTNSITIFEKLTGDYLNSLFLTIYGAILGVFVGMYLSDKNSDKKNDLYKNNIIGILFLMLFYVIFSLIFNIK